MITVVSTTDTRHAGSCNGATSTNGDLSSTNTQSTAVSSSSSLPCTYVFAGEDAAPDSSHSEISFFLAPPTPAGGYATATIVFYSLPVAFNKFKLYYELNTSFGQPFAFTTQIPTCADSPVPANPICLESLTKAGRGATAVIRFVGTGVDPRVGGG